MRFIMAFALFFVLMTPIAAAQGFSVSSDGEVAGFKRVRVDVVFDSPPETGTLHFLVDGNNHSRVELSAGSSEGFANPAAGEWYDDCWTSNDSGLTWSPIHRDEHGIPSAFIVNQEDAAIRCDLTALPENQEALLTVSYSTDSGVESVELVVIASTIDVLPPPPPMAPILYAIGSIVLSIVVLFGWLRWKDRETRHRNGLAFVLPAVLALAILSFYPVAYGIMLSFTDAHDEALGDEEFNGIDNFVEVFSSEGFLRVMIFTLVWTIINVVFHVGVGGALAMLLQQKIRGKIAYRTMLLLPWAIPSYISVLVWKGMFHPEGMINWFLGTQTDFFSGVTEAQTMVILVNIWLGVPFMMMSISGALQSIPDDLHEAAKVEGVSDWGRLRHITLPLLKPTVMPLALMGFIWTFNMFNVIYLLTSGGPNLWSGPGGTDILITYVFDLVYEDGALGLAAAWSVVIFLMLMAFSWSLVKGGKATEAAT